MKALSGTADRIEKKSGTYQWGVVGEGLWHIETTNCQTILAGGRSHQLKIVCPLGTFLRPQSSVLLTHSCN